MRARGRTPAAYRLHRTDNDSAKMATDKGVIQGFCGVAAVDAKHQIIVDAQALGSGSEQEILVPVVEALKNHGLITPESLVTADAGYHSEENLKRLDALGINALIADNAMRARDPRFAEQAKHKGKSDPLYDKRCGQTPNKARYRPEDFTYDPKAGTCTCPTGKALYRNGAHCTIGTNHYVKFTAPQSACLSCEQRAKCLRHPDKTKVRQIVFFTGRQKNAPETFSQRMKRRIDSDQGRRLYGQRFATVEPVFGNIRANKRMNRFTLRGKTTVDGQWKLFCLVHNIEKLAHHRYAQSKQDQTNAKQ